MTKNRFSNKKQITKGSTGKLSEKSAGVYKITDSTGETLYIGKAKAGRLGDRIYEHKGHFKGGTNFRYQETGEKEPRILCKQDTRESRPDVFKKSGLFLLPVKNGFYNIIKGEGYMDIPKIEDEPIEYKSKLNFTLDTSSIGDSEMQHLDHAYAVSVVRTFMDDPTLVLTIRGRKYTPEFKFKVGKYKIMVRGVQTEVDAGYEGEKQVVLVEAKNNKASNTIIRQLYYPYRQWQKHTNKDVYTLFFDKEKSKKGDVYSIWQFEFTDPKDYNSIKLVKSKKFIVKNQ